MGDIPKFADLTDEQQHPYMDKATEILVGLLWCDRAWEAWDVGTMTQADFYNADEDDGCVSDTAVLLYGFVQAQCPVPFYEPDRDESGRIIESAETRARHCAELKEALKIK